MSEAVNESEAGGATSPASSYEGIAVLGSHPETKLKAPFNEGWLIYACSPDNSPYGYSEHTSPLPRVDVLFELHVPIADVSRPYRYLRWLEDQDTPIVMRDASAMPQFPKSVAYPEADLKARFGPYAFTNSIAYMIAKAIVDCEAMGIRKLGVWGVLQRGREEFLKHRTGVQQMLWEAHKARLDIVLPPEARQLLNPPPEDW